MISVKRLAIVCCAFWGLSSFAESPAALCGYEAEKFSGVAYHSGEMNLPPVRVSLAGEFVEEGEFLYEVWEVRLFDIEGFESARYKLRFWDDCELIYLERLQ